MTELNFNDIIEWNILSETERTDILRRPAVLAGDKIATVVSGIIQEVKTRGDDALREFSARFDRTEVKKFGSSCIVVGEEPFRQIKSLIEIGPGRFGKGISIAEQNSNT